MGSCVSRPSWVGRRKRSNGTKINPETAARDADPRSSVTLQPISVLKDPTGDDLYAKYELGKELGRGEFGVTHQCVNLETGELLACKTISKNKLTTEVDVQDVRREVEIMRSLPKHPNIVSLKEAYEDKDNVHLVMELCAGGELFDRIVARGHYSERAAADVIKSIIEIIKVCHEHGVMHRDLKPENFLFANTNEDSPLKAIDFGLSIFFTPGQRFSEIVGSPYYMAPEVLRRNYGHEIDVWSAGVILYILLCGVPPFWAETEEGIAQAIVKSHVDFERDPWPKISEDAKDLVKGMLDPNPYNRLTVEEVLDHSWIRNANNNPNVSLGENVRTRIKQFSVMNKFKKKVLRVVADNLPNDQLDGIRQTFNMMDTDNNGTLSFEELKDGLHKIGHQIADRDVKLLIEAADMEGNGTLNCDEFVTVSVHLRRIGSDQSLSEAFRVFDKNGSGFIEFDELREALSGDNLGPNNEQVIREIILDADLDKDGRISYEEFKAMMKTGMDWKMSSRQYSRAMLNALSTRIFKDKSMPLQYTSMKLNNKSMLLRNRSMQLRNKSSRLKH